MFHSSYCSLKHVSASLLFLWLTPGTSYCSLKPSRTFHWSFHITVEHLYCSVDSESFIPYCSYCSHVWDMFYSPYYPQTCYHICILHYVILGSPKVYKRRACPRVKYKFLPISLPTACLLQRSVSRITYPWIWALGTRRLRTQQLLLFLSLSTCTLVELLSRSYRRLHYYGIE